MDDEQTRQEIADEQLINDAFQKLLNSYLASRHRKFLSGLLIIHSCYLLLLVVFFFVVVLALLWTVFLAVVLRLAVVRLAVVAFLLRVVRVLRLARVFPRFLTVVFFLV